MKEQQIHQLFEHFGKTPLTIKAKDFATELTSHNVTEKDLKGQSTISKEHIDNNLAVRKMLIERGVKPKQLKTSEGLKPHRKKQ